MKKDIRYSKAPDGVDDALISAQIIEDFLPPPEKLIPKEATRKITITLSQKSVEFFKEKSKEKFSITILKSTRTGITDN